MTVVLHRNAKLFYKVYKLLGSSCMTGYSETGYMMVPCHISTMRRYITSETYFLTIVVREKDILA